MRRCRGVEPLGLVQKLLAIAAPTNFYTSIDCMCPNGNTQPQAVTTVLQSMTILVCDE
jgi:hypothetical protein